MTVDEMLNEMESDEISAQNETPVCVIDAINRQMIIPPELQLLGVERDKLVNTMHVQCPKIVGNGQDLSKDYQLFIVYENANGDPDCAHIENMQVVGDNIEFDWTVGENVTKYKGNVRIAFAAVDPNATQGRPDDHRWNTTYNDECYSIAGLECTQKVAKSNPDALAQIWEAIDEIKLSGGGGIVDIQRDYYINLGGVDTADNSGIYLLYSGNPISGGCTCSVELGASSPEMVIYLFSYNGMSDCACLEKHTGSLATFDLTKYSESDKFVIGVGGGGAKYSFQGNSLGYVLYEYKQSSVEISEEAAFSKTEFEATFDASITTTVKTDISEEMSRLVNEFDATSDKVGKIQMNAGIKSIVFEDTSIVFLGDSIVEGYGSSDYNGGEHGTSGHIIENTVKTWYRNTGKNCWVNKMIDYIDQNYNRYKNVIACNNGVGGFTCQDIYDNLETLTKDDEGSRANVAVLSIGINDRNNGDKNLAIVQPIIKTINWLIDYGIQPIILTNTPCKPDAFYEGNTAEVLQTSIMKACDTMGVKCFCVLSEFNYYLWVIGKSLDDVMYDDLHPNDEGYEIMFQIIKRILQL